MGGKWGNQAHAWEDRHVEYAKEQKDSCTLKNMLKSSHQCQYSLCETMIGWCLWTYIAIMPQSYGCSLCLLLVLTISSRLMSEYMHVITIFCQTKQNVIVTKTHQNRMAHSPCFAFLLFVFTRIKVYPKAKEFINILM